MFLDTDPEEIPGPQTNREVSLGRHKAQCSICKHPNCKEIERDWLDWVGLATIEFEYKVSRHSIRRHCLALGLVSKRRRNIIRALERIAERHDTVDLSGSNVVSAIKEIVKLIGAQKAVEAAQSADEKPAAQEEMAKESDNGAIAGSIAEMLDKMSGAELGKGQDGNVEAQSPPTPTLQ